MDIDKEREWKKILLEFEVVLGVYEHIFDNDTHALVARVKYKEKLIALIARAKELGIELTIEEPFYPFVLRMQLREKSRP